LRIVVCDTGPVLHLEEAGVLELLGRMGEVLIPPSVDQEVQSLRTDWTTMRPAWLRVTPLPESLGAGVRELRDAAGLGPGEAEAIVLARHLRADWLLTDDAGARVLASTLGLEVHGSLGVILWAAATGHTDLPGALASLDRLARSSLWVTPAVLAEARKAIRRLLG